MQSYASLREERKEKVKSRGEIPGERRGKAREEIRECAGEKE